MLDEQPTENLIKDQITLNEHSREKVSHDVVRTLSAVDLDETTHPQERKTSVRSVVSPKHQ